MPCLRVSAPSSAQSRPSSRSSAREGGVHVELARKDAPSQRAASEGRGYATVGAPYPPLQRCTRNWIYAQLRAPRLMPSAAESNVIEVPAHTDFKLHDITDSSDERAKEPLDLNQPSGSRRFLAGNRRFLTRRLWGVGNQPPYRRTAMTVATRRSGRPCQAVQAISFWSILIVALRGG